MDPNSSQPPISSGATQATYYHSTTSAGAGSALPATDWAAPQQHEQQEPRMIPTIKGYSNECVQALVDLKDDGNHYGWKYIFDQLRRKYGHDSLPALNPGMLRGAWNRLQWVPESAPGAASTGRQPAPPAIPPVPFGGSYGASQAGYRDPYAAAQSNPGSWGSYGTPQSNLGGTFGASQPGSWAQHAPPQPGSSGSFASAPNPNQQLPSVASLAPVWNQNRGHGGSHGPAATHNQQLPPIASFYPVGNQGHHYAASQPGGSGSNDQTMHHPPVAANHWVPWDREYEFTEEQKTWIFKRGLAICPGYGWNEIARQFQRTLNDDGPGPARLKDVFNEMRGRPR